MYPYTSEMLKSFMSHTDDSRLLSYVASHALVPDFVLEVLKRVDDVSVLVAVAANKNVSSSILTFLSTDPSNRVKETVARNVNTPPEVLARLSTDASYQVRSAVARNVNTPPDVLSRLSRTVVTQVSLKDWQVVYYSAANPSLPAADLLRLASLPSGEFGQAVGVNPKTPPEFLWSLAKSDDVKVRASVAANRLCPPDLLKVLLEDTELYVAMTVLANPSCPHDWLFDAAKVSEDFRTAVASNKGCPSHLLEVLAEDRSAVVRGTVAANPACLDAVRSVLAGDDVDFVRANAVATGFEVFGATGPVVETFRFASSDHQGFTAVVLLARLTDFLLSSASADQTADGFSRLYSDRVFDHAAGLLVAAASCSEPGRVGGSFVLHDVYRSALLMLFSVTVSYMFAFDLCSVSQRLTLQQSAVDDGIDFPVQPAVKQPAVKQSAVKQSGGKKSDIGLSF